MKYKLSRRDRLSITCKNKSLFNNLNMKNILLGLFSMQNFQNIFYIFNYCNILQKQMKTPKSDSSKILKKLFVIKNLSRLFRRWKIIFSFNEKKTYFQK